MDVLTPEQRHRSMSSIRSKDTSIEAVLRKALWHHGYRYRKNYRALPGSPDIAITKYRIAISSIVYCAHCGDVYQRTQWLLKGEHVPVWRCVSRLLHHKLGTDCPSRTIYEKDLHAAVVKAVNQLIGQKDELLPAFKANVEKIVGCSNSVKIAALDEKMLVIQKELLKKTGARQDYADLTDQSDAIRGEKQRLLLEDAEKEGVRQQMKVVEDFLDRQQEEIDEYDEALVTRLIEKITVYDDRLVVRFKSGIEMGVDM